MTRIEIPGHPIIGVRADNPGPLTLTGTNSWIVGAAPAWLVDPGPDLLRHVESLAVELERRGGLGGVALTHDHADHAGALAAIRARFPDAPLAAGRGDADLRLHDGDRIGPLEAMRTPGHAPDHFAFLAGEAVLTGDAVLGEGSVFIAPDPGALSGYLAALERLRELPLSILLPGHGPVIDDPAGRIDEYIAHRLDRERRLLAALDAGARSVPQLLDAAWSDVPPAMRPAAAVTLAAHLDKLDEEGRLPAGVQRPGPGAWPAISA